MRHKDDVIEDVKQALIKRLSTPGGMFYTYDESYHAVNFFNGMGKSLLQELMSNEEFDEYEFTSRIYSLGTMVLNYMIGGELTDELREVIKHDKG